MTERPKIIIGAETEYGIFVRRNGENRNSLVDTTGTAIKIVDRASKLNLNIFKRSLEGISDRDEHNAAEEAGASEEDNSGASREAVRQRRGLTGHILGNGARFYVDMGHPEYSIPETTNPLDALLAQKAGDRITEICRAAIQKLLAEQELDIRLDKNNSDGNGNSYAAHENYSLSRNLFGQITGSTNTDEHSITVNFFASRQIITGAGKVGNEAGKEVPYQITQRADFIERPMSPNTIEDRGIINTRDHSYGGENIARFHVINGDGNLSELSLYLKFGTAALFFMMLESGFLAMEGGELATPLKRPVRSYKNVSRDLTLRHKVHFLGGAKRTALEMQQQFCSLAKIFVREYKLQRIWADVVEKWEGTLEGLESADRAGHELSGNLDWVIKEDLINKYRQKKDVGPLHDYCRMINMEYHNTNPQKGIYEKFLRQGRVMRIVTDEEIEKAFTSPPESTRAWLRGEVVGRYREQLSFVTWGGIRFKNGGIIHMRNPFSGSRQDIEPLLEGDPDAGEFLSKLSLADIEGLEIIPSREEDL